NSAPAPARLPDGTPSVIVGNEDLLVVQVDVSPTKTTFCAIEADTGKIRRQVTIDGEKIGWRGLGDGGTLFTVSDKAVTAFDLVSGKPDALWKRSDVQ